MDQVVIIIVHYNGGKDTVQCLESLKDIQHQGFEFKVVVVDNASREPFQLPKHFSDQTFQVIRSQANLGFTGGNNLGIWYAKEHLQPSYFCLLNNDTLVAPDFLQNLYDYLSSHEEVGLVSPKIYFAKGSEFHRTDYRPAERGRVLWYAGGVIDWRNLDAFHLGVDELDRGQFDQTSVTEFVTGCCILAPVSVVERIGTLDKKYFVYLEDVDWSQRVKKAGYKVMYLPQATIWHKNAGSSGGSGSTVHQYYQSRNRLLFAIKHGGWRTRLLALKLAWQFVSRGTWYQRRAVLDLLLWRFGKQPIV